MSKYIQNASMAEHAIAYYKNEGQAEAAARIRAFASGKWGKRQGSLNFERGGYF